MLIVHHKNFSRKDSDESKAAELIADKLRELPCGGSILVISNLSLPGGEAIKDIDIVVVGYLDDYIIKPYFHHQNPNAEVLKVCSFCFTIELKRHTIEDVSFNDFGGVYVKYGTRLHNVVDQSQKQRDSLRNVLKRVRNIEPFVTNLIFMQQIDSSLVPKDKTGWNIIFRDFDADTIFATAARYNKPYTDKHIPNQDVLFSFKKDYLEKELSMAFDLFLTSTQARDSLSRQKFEYITNRNESVDIIDGSRLNIIKGRAGTGKTIQLIKFAYKRVVENHKRCLLLTYNHALVSDIKRIATFCDFPDGSDEAFSVQTIHSFFFHLLETNGIPANFSNDDFEKIYAEKIESLLNRENLQAISDWDYILIDEAQDCSEAEIKLWTKLFSPGHIVIADGVDQFVRNIKFSYWGNCLPPEQITTCELSISKRQKSNIVSFVNAFASSAGISWHVEENPELTGGRVIVTNHFDKSLYDDLKNKLLTSGNVMYDMLFLVDSKLGSEKYLPTALASLQQIGIKVFNGAFAGNRDKYPVDPEESRLYNYNSCRGIEGWCVICLYLDELFKEKLRYSPYISKRDFETEADRQARIVREVYKWILMPLTRAIDTLVITLNDINSPIGQLLSRLHEERADYVIWDYY